MEVHQQFCVGKKDTGIVILADGWFRASLGSTDVSQVASISWWLPAIP